MEQITSKDILNSTSIDELLDIKMQLIVDREMIEIDFNLLFHNGKPTKEKVRLFKNKKTIIKSKLKIVEQKLRKIRALNNIEHGKYCVEIVRRLKYKYPKIHKELDYKNR